MAPRKRKKTNLPSITKVLLSAIVISSLVLNLFFWHKFKSQNLVVQVADGDTFQVKSGKRVRLLGVDAPEYDYCAGPEAKKRLQELIEGKIVTIKEETKETYGRFLALVYVDGTLVNEVMLETGATLSGSMLQADLVDEMIIYMAPVLLGSQARPLFKLPGMDNMDQKINLEISDIRMFGKDMRIIARPVIEQAANN